MSLACFCVHLETLDQGRDHVVTIWIIFCWCWLLSVHSIPRIYVTGVTAIYPIYIQAVSSQTLTATCVEGPARIGTLTEILRTMTGKKTWEKQQNDDWKKLKSQSAAFFDVNFVVKHRDEQSAWEAAALIPRYHWLRPVALHWCLLRCRQATRPWRAARDVWIFGQKICDLMRLLMWRSLLMRLDWCLAPTTGVNFTNFLNFMDHRFRFDSQNVTIFMRGFAPASMAETWRATLAFTFMPRGQD